MMGPNKTNFHKVEPPIGVDGLFSLLQFLQNPKAVESQLKKIQEYTDKANASVDRLYKTKELERLLLDAETKHREAMVSSLKAKNEADSIIEEARSKALSMEETTRASTHRMVKEAERLNQHAELLMVQARKEGETAARDINDTQVLKEALATSRAELEAREAEVMRKESLLAQL